LRRARQLARLRHVQTFRYRHGRRWWFAGNPERHARPQIRLPVASSAWPGNERPRLLRTIADRDLLAGRLPARHSVRVMSNALSMHSIAATRSRSRSN
jgi:hypothetical protein